LAIFSVDIDGVPLQTGRDNLGGMLSRYANLAVLARLGNPDDLANVVLFLASDLSRFVSGVILNVDGGI
jgi:3-oxoacyl-[acyl-carrier protein] reductase